ncbi:hypothetical protein M5K25_026459 [Dendrobium thyrsiflorum]|uniref:DUF4283 domain-containing protein n=1 Tax=Dendrobium thyrsiflorum TaxID=117978 RepID=A0ABD0TXJ2_DENTH
METTKPKNPWQRLEHIRIVQAEEKIAISKDGVTVDLYMEVVNENIQLLNRAVVGRILGKRLPYFVLSSEIKRQWGRFGEYQLSTVGQDCFVCIFSSLEARDVVLCGGPCFVGGNIVGLDRWTPQFSPDSLDGLSSPVWICLPDLPL